MVQRAQETHLPIRWVVADTVYGHCSDLRQWLEEQGYSYAASRPVHRSRLRADADWPAAKLCRQHRTPGAACPRLATPLTKPGDQRRAPLMPLARFPVAHAGMVDGCHWLVVRRCLDDPHELAYFLVWAPPNTSLPIMVLAIGARWRIEEGLQASKDLGLDHYEGRSYLGWYRHITLVLLASAFLVAVTVHHHLIAAAPPVEVAAHSPLIPLTTSEARHLLAHLFFPTPTSASLICHWSRFRRTHQYWAGYYHRRRRKKLTLLAG